MAERMTPQVPIHPLKRIALTCSGGGYRAAAFHLGAMAYLHRVRYGGEPLLHNVKAISTVSGGTISGVIYAQRKQKGESFEEIYRFIMHRLRSFDLIREGLEKLNDPSKWRNEGKRKNLINAFAEIYDEKYTEGATFEVFKDMSASHLDDVMFNATEFSNGIIFRFQNGGHFGNNYFPVRRPTIWEVKLADMIAASSCFTGGFEPIEWPGDFLHPHSPGIEKIRDGSGSTGLMDGGIYDNQGIDSILLAEKRVRTDPYDLIIVSDVTSPYMTPFKFLQPEHDGQGRSWHHWTYRSVIAKVDGMYKSLRRTLVIVAALALLLPLLVMYGNHVLTGVGLTLAALALVAYLMVGKVKKRVGQWTKAGRDYVVSKLQDQIPVEDLQVLNASDTTFRFIEPLVVDRVRSLITLMSSVFLKTVRRLVYGRLYESDRHAYRRVSNLIRELTQMDYEAQLARNQNNRGFYQNLEGCDPILVGDYAHVIGPNIKKVAEEAASFGTTLWFSQDEKLNNMLDYLVASGACSMCFNLLIYLTEIKHTPDIGYDAIDQTIRDQLDQVYEQCMTDWLRFKQEPKFLVHEMANHGAGF